MNEGGSGFEAMECFGKLLSAAQDLRAAQRDYLARRGDEKRGKTVGRMAKKLDEAIAVAERLLDEKKR